MLEGDIIPLKENIEVVLINPELYLATLRFLYLPNLSLRVKTVSGLFLFFSCYSKNIFHAALLLDITYQMDKLPLPIGIIARHVS